MYICPLLLPAPPPKPTVVSGQGKLVRKEKKLNARNGMLTKKPMDAARVLPVLFSKMIT
jgi:hypothetical protein